MKNIVYFFSSLFVFLFVILLLRPESVIAVEPTFSGVLRNGVGVPIPGAQVQLLGGSTSSTMHTGTDGSFSTNIPPGTYSLSVITPAQGSISPSLNILMPSAITINGDTVQDLILPTKTLTVTVFGPNGDPVSGALVSNGSGAQAVPITLFPGGPIVSPTTNSNEARTDASGIVHLALIPITINSTMYLSVTPPSGSNLFTKYLTLETFSEDTNITVSYIVIDVGPIAAPTTPQLVNNAISVSSPFIDQVVLDGHTATWDWGDGTTSSGTITESNGSGTVFGTHTYTSAGVYTITLTVNDSKSGQGISIFQYISVYNPTPQGLFTGARIFTSPAGAYPQDSSLTGKVMFGVIVKYSGTTPTGSVSMNFKAADFDFDATSISMLITSNGMATVRGSGTLNGSEGYTFLATGLNSQSGGPAIRFQIKDSSNIIIYDSQPGASDDTVPTTPIAGQVVVH